ncbi:MAG: DUF1002 domain-containing protein [Clostridiales bacterium]|nr:DUF1002 domain-containing protein [Clostridiales bacterium]
MRLKRFTAGALALSMLATLPTAALASGSAASEDTAGYLILGEDLSDSQEETVLKLLDVDDLSDYEVSYTTHEEEEELFGSYLSASLLGTKALSSILLVPAVEVSGNLLYTTAPWASSTDCYTLSVEHGVLTAEKITTLE